MIQSAASTDELLSCIIKGMEEVKAKELMILDLRAIENTVCDYFILCTGTSNTHVQAIVNSIQKITSREGRAKPWHVEGYEQAEWVLMDYLQVVVHVFQKRIRTFYDLENLWGDAQVTTPAATY